MGGTGVLTTTDREYSYYTADELLAASFGGVVETTITVELTLTYSIYSRLMEIAIKT
jgi:hypothetical protein